MNEREPSTPERVAGRLHLALPPPAEQRRAGEGRRRESCEFVREGSALRVCQPGDIAMLSWGMVREIRRLLHAEKMSQRKIATRLGVSRTVVGAIARGRRAERYGRQRGAVGVPDYRCRVGDNAAACAAGTDLPACGEPCAADYYGDQPLRRCGGCGGKVYLPCVLCAARASACRARVCRARASDVRRRLPIS